MKKIQGSGYLGGAEKVISEGRFPVKGERRINLDLQNGAWDNQLCREVSLKIDKVFDF